MNLVAYHDLKWVQKIKFKEFCHKASQSAEPAATNMEDLPNLAHSRFRPPNLLLVGLENNRIVATSSCYTSDFSPRVGILGARTWVNKGSRNKQLIRELFLPAQKAWARDRGIDIIALTMNQYNKGIVDLFKRQVVKRTPRTDKHMFFNGLSEVPYPVIIRSIPQWVIYEKLADWEFDWSSLRA